MQNAAFKVVATKQPLSQAVIGYRMILAHINRAQYDFWSQEMVQSFQGPHRIAESGDYCKRPTPEQVEKWLGETMPFNGITGIVVY